MDALTTFDEYVAWYLWAAATAGDDAIACHTAATAAMHALSVGASRDQATAEARTAARDEAALRQTRSDYGPNHHYVDWFLWARSNLHLPEARCHEAARAAVATTMAGGSEQAAREAATRLLLPPPAAPVRVDSATEPEAPAPSADRPAVAALFTHGASLRWEAAVAATMLDLAVRGHLRIVMEPAGLRCEIPRPSQQNRLAGFEHAVARLAVDGAPAAALLPDYQDEDGNQWFTAFDKAVMDEAHRAGLLRAQRRWRRVHWSLSSDTWNGATDTGQAAMYRWRDIRRTLVTASQPPRLPSPGACVEDPMLAWAVALDVTPDVLRAMLPVAVWSSMGGRWRQVSVPRVSFWRSAKGMPPRWILRKSRLDERRSFTGRVIRRWTVSGYTGYVGSYTNHYLAVDDGASAEAHVWHVDAVRYREFPRDSDVRVTVDHKLRLVEIVPLRGPSPVPEAS